MQTPVTIARVALAVGAMAGLLAVAPPRALTGISAWLQLLSGGLTLAALVVRFMWKQVSFESLNYRIRTLLVEEVVAQASRNPQVSLHPTPATRIQLPFKSVGPVASLLSWFAHWRAKVPSALPPVPTLRP